MTDQPVQPPASHLERWTAALGNLARPFALYAAAGSSAFATVAIVLREMSLIEGAAFIAAAWGGVGGLYWAKATEESRKASVAGNVEVAKATAPTDPQTIPIPESSKPPWERS